MRVRLCFVAWVTPLACACGIGCGVPDTGTTTFYPPATQATTELVGGEFDPLCEPAETDSACAACRRERCCAAFAACTHEVACACAMACPRAPEKRAACERDCGPAEHLPALERCAATRCGRDCT